MSSALTENDMTPGVRRSCMASVDPQRGQKPRRQPGEDWYHLTELSSESQVNDEAWIGPAVQKAAPVAFRQIEQWQLPNAGSGPSIRKRARPHRQEPRCVTYRSAA